MSRDIPIETRLDRAIAKNVESMDRGTLESLVAERLWRFFDKEATHDEKMGFIEANEQ